MADSPCPLPVEFKLPGVRCPKCGRRKFRQVYTRHRGVATIRVKMCWYRECNHKIRTRETVESLYA